MALNNPARGANALNSPARGVLLQALFRPITVVVPDRQLIMENMLMAEGFVEAKMLAKKFASLYYLLEDLLSPAKYVSVPCTLLIVTHDIVIPAHCFVA